jgi:hypothetical protein
VQVLKLKNATIYNFVKGKPSTVYLLIAKRARAKGKILSVFTIHNVVETNERKTRSCYPNRKTQPLLEEKTILQRTETARNGRIC